MGKTVKNTPSEEIEQLREVFSTTLPVARKKAGLTQEEIARLSGVGTGRFYTARLEAGIRTPSTNSLKKLAEILNCSADFLLGLSSYHPLSHKNSIHDQLLCEIDALDMEEKIDLLNELKKKHKKEDPPAL